MIAPLKTSDETGELISDLKKLLREFDFLNPRLTHRMFVDMMALIDNMHQRIRKIEKGSEESEG